MRKINRTRHSLKLFLLFLLIVAVIPLALKGLFAFLHTNPAFKIVELEVSGACPLDPSLKMIRKVYPLGLDNRIKESIQDKNIFKIDLKELSRRIIAQHPEILEAEVRRLLPNKIIINLKRRIPFARIESARYPYKIFFVDKEGFVLTDIEPTSFNELPLIVGINTKLARIREGKQSESVQLTKALSLLKEIATRKAAADYEIAKIDVTSYKNISFFIDEGIEVRIGAGDFERRLILLERTFSKLKANGYQPKYIDLRFGDPIIGTR